MTAGQHRARSAPSSPADELAQDIRREKRIAWKGVFAVLVAAAVAVARQRWWA